jgi:hypothetical protein
MSHQISRDSMWLGLVGVGWPLFLIDLTLEAWYLPWYYRAGIGNQSGFGKLNLKKTNETSKRCSRISIS